MKKHEKTLKNVKKRKLGKYAFTSLLTLSLLAGNTFMEPAKALAADFDGSMNTSLVEVAKQAASDDDNASIELSTDITGPNYNDNGSVVINNGEYIDVTYNININNKEGSKITSITFEVSYYDGVYTPEVLSCTWTGESSIDSSSWESNFAFLGSGDCQAKSFNYRCQVPEDAQAGSMKLRLKANDIGARGKNGFELRARYGYTIPLGSGAASKYGREAYPFCGHTPNNDTDTYEEVTKPTCTSNGYTTVYCSHCNAKLEEKDTTDPVPHTYGEWTITKEPTVDEFGEKVRYCTVCQNEDKEQIPKLTAEPTTEASDPETEATTEQTEDSTEATTEQT
ncbi:MAG: hypothetical protein ACI4EF_09700, partial [Coprococcus sp.]